jgi:hypothetical protein
MSEKRSHHPLNNILQHSMPGASGDPVVNPPNFNVPFDMLGRPARVKPIPVDSQNFSRPTTAPYRPDCKGTDFLHPACLTGPKLEM